MTAPSGMLELPVCVEDITADWLTLALSISCPGVQVLRLAHEEVLWGTGTKVCVRVAYNDAGQVAGLPTSLFVKGGFAEHRMIMEDCYELEVRFYRDLQPLLQLNVPRAFFAGSDLARRQHIVVLEDLRQRNVRFCRVQQPLTFEQAASHLDILAKMHARWWNAPGLADGSAIGPLTVWEPLPDKSIGVYQWSRLEPDTWADIMQLPRAVAIPKFMHDRKLMERALLQLTAFGHGGPHCLLHGDYHLGNLYFDADGRAGTLDWQSCRRGHWSHDVTYFLVSALDIADRRRWDRALLQYYLTRLQAHGVSEPPDFDATWQAFRLQIIDGLYFWLVNPVEFQSEENNCAVAPRFAMAALDYDTFALIV